MISGKDVTGEQSITLPGCSEPLNHPQTFNLVFSFKFELEWNLLEPSWSNPTTVERKLAAMSQLIADQIGRKNSIIEFHFVAEAELAGGDYVPPTLHIF